MGFTVKLDGDVVSVEPGRSATLTIEVSRSVPAETSGPASEPETFELSQEGLDPEWVAVPVPTFQPSGSEPFQVRLVLRPPRTSESVAGSYPFVVRVRSLATGETRACQAMLEVAPFHHLSADIEPRRGAVGPTRRTDAFELTLANLGNTEETLVLGYSDPEDECVLSFETDQVVLAPGQQRRVAFEAGLRRIPPFGGVQLFAFNVTARSVSQPAVSCSAQAHLERRPLISTAGLVAIFLLALLASAWWTLRPRQPVARVTLESSSILRDSPLVVQWRLDSADSLKLSVGDEERVVMQPMGTTQFFPKAPGMLVAIPYRGSVQGQRIEIPFSVEEPPAVPKPKIEEFSISPTTIELGQPLAVRYRARNAARLTLSPPGIDLNQAAPEVEIKPERLGTIEYTLVAVNDKGESDRKTIKVTVVDPSQAKVVAFAASPEKLTAGPGLVRLEWQLTNAVRAELIYNGTKQKVDPTEGFQEVDVQKTTTFRLVAYDSEGRTVEKAITVTVVPPEPPTETELPMP
ncbi:MAG: hypothetical protein N2109_04985 [Fimbriimonadales bacterium]|nr:hypothetical protein [Fimbriimonadales bacterium]